MGGIVSIEDEVRCPSGQRRKAVGVCVDVCLGDRVCCAQSQIRAFIRANGGWWLKKPFQPPNARGGRSAAKGQRHFVFVSDDVIRICPSAVAGIARVPCPPRDTPDHLARVIVFPNAKVRHNGSGCSPGTITRSVAGRKRVVDRQVSGQRISADVEFRQEIHFIDPRRKFAGQLVIFQLKSPHLVEILQLGWYRPSKLVPIEYYHLKLGQASELGWYRPSKLVVAYMYVPEVGQPSDFRRYRPGKPVVSQVQVLEVGQVSDFRRYRPAQVLVMQGQTRQCGQVSDFGGQSAVQHLLSRTTVRSAGSRVEPDPCDAVRVS